MPIGIHILTLRSPKLVYCMCATKRKNVCIVLVIRNSLHNATIDDDGHVFLGPNMATVCVYKCIYIYIFSYLYIYIYVFPHAMNSNLYKYANVYRNLHTYIYI